MWKKNSIIVFILFWRVIGINSQDLHYSQFYYNYHNLSPSNIGIFDGNDRVTLNYKNQWSSTPVPYNTISFLYDANRSLRNSKTSYGFGFGMDYDRAGTSKLNMAKFVFGGSITHVLNSMNRFTLGICPAIAQRRISSEGLRWGKQWNGDKYDPNISPNENFQNSGDFFFDLNAGISYEFSLTKRTKILLSGGAYHLNRPNQSFYGVQLDQVNLPVRFSSSAQLSIGLGTYLDLILAGNYQAQEEYREIVGSGLIRFRFNRTPGSIFNILGGCNLRVDDAIIPTLGVEYKNWLVSGSYDINTSFFKVTTDKKGGPEIAVQYVFAKVKKSGIYKKCPFN
ncbi:MAG: PorP/SprF family type IX secretion system membrane protein [Saprospiraceae bacterium]